VCVYVRVFVCVSIKRGRVCLLHCIRNQKLIGKWQKVSINIRGHGWANNWSVVRNNYSRKALLKALLSLLLSLETFLDFCFLGFSINDLSIFLGSKFIPISTNIQTHWAHQEHTKIARINEIIWRRNVFNVFKYLKRIFWLNLWLLARKKWSSSLERKTHV